jgi:hypothetical protein
MTEKVMGTKEQPAGYDAEGVTEKFDIGGGRARTFYFQH